MGTATKHVESSAKSLPAPGVVVRPARADDDVAGLVYSTAPQAYSAVAGSEQRARAAIEKRWRVSGPSASFEHAIVAELDGRLAGVLIGFPARNRHRLHGGLLRRGFRYVAARRWPLLMTAWSTAPWWISCPWAAGPRSISPTWRSSEERPSPAHHSSEPR